MHFQGSFHRSVRCLLLSIDEVKRTRQLPSEGNISFLRSVAQEKLPQSTLPDSVLCNILGVLVQVPKASVP